MTHIDDEMDTFDKVYAVAESMILDDIKQTVIDTMVDWQWAYSPGDGNYVLTELGLRQLETHAATREVLVHFNVDVPIELTDEDAKKRAVAAIQAAAFNGMTALEELIALVDPT